MNGRIFITGTTSTLMGELVDMYLAKGYAVAVALDPQEEFPFPADLRVSAGQAGETERKPLEKRVARIAWNRRSSLSAQAAVYQASRALQGIEKAIVIHAPGRENKAFHEISAGYIEESVDFGMKSYLFLLREIVGLMQKNGRGTLSFVMHDGGSEVLSPVEACVSGSFKALAQSLFMFYQNEPITITGFRSSSTQVEDYAQYIVRTLEERQPKTSEQWYKFSDKSGFFQSLPLGLRKK